MDDVWVFLQFYRLISLNKHCSLDNIAHSLRLPASRKNCFETFPFNELLANILKWRTLFAGELVSVLFQFFIKLLPFIPVLCQSEDFITAQKSHDAITKQLYVLWRNQRQFHGHWLNWWGWFYIKHSSSSPNEQRVKMCNHQSITSTWRIIYAPFCLFNV